MKATMIISSKCIFDSISDEPFEGYVAIKDNRIIAVDRGSDYSRYVDENTVIKDVGDRTVMSGFHDSHIHLLLSGMYSTYVNLADCKSEEETVLKVKEAADADPNKEGWVKGFSWYHVFWDNRQMPTAKSLDKYFPDRPVFLLNAEGHGAWVNTAAMKIMGITKDTPNPPGGVIEKDENGEPTGILMELAIGLASKYAYDLSDEEEMNIIKVFMEDAKKAGITSINDVQPWHHGNMGRVSVYSKLDKADELTLRIHAAPDLLGDLDQVIEDKIAYSSDKIQIKHLKQFLDGVATTHTALVLEDYTDATGNRGIEIYDPESIRKAVQEAHKRGLSVKLHSCGDRSARYALDFIEAAINKYGKNHCRHAIEHLELVYKDDYKRFAELNVFPSVQPEHLALTQTFAAHPFPEVLGRERADASFAYGSLYKAAGILGIGSDCPVVAINPFLEIFRAVARVCNDFEPKGGWIPSEKLTLSQILKCYTYGSAYGVLREDELGSLTAGKFADIVVIDKNIFAIPEKELLERKVIMTVMDGKIIYEA